jgi:hypothetical protein
MKIYQAPWGKPLTIGSAILTVVCVGVTIIHPPQVMHELGAWVVLLRWLPMLVMAGCLPFVIRGYSLTQDAILIRRLFWTTRLERADLISAEHLPKAMRKSLRTCGNGGFFSITGWYWSKSLGPYRAFVTDLNRTVVLRFKKRTVVISPAPPEEFVAELNEANPIVLTADCRDR